MAQQRSLVLEYSSMPSLRVQAEQDTQLGSDQSSRWPIMASKRDSTGRRTGNKSDNILSMWERAVSIIERMTPPRAFERSCWFALPVLSDLQSTPCQGPLFSWRFWRLREAVSAAGDTLSL